MADRATPSPPNPHLPSSNAAPQSHPPIPSRDWETSPLYLTLSARLDRTDAALSQLSQQVASLGRTVQAALSSHRPPPLPAHSHPNGSGGIGVFSPFDAPDPSPFIPPSSAPPPSSSPSSGQDPAVAALTQQISALSSSVAQLQRLQSQQSGALSRQNSFQPAGALPRHMHDGAGAGGAGGGGAGAGAAGGFRPGLGRSMSSSVIPASGGKGGGEADKWGPPTPGGGASKYGWGSVGGGLTTPGGTGQGMMSPGGLGPGGAGAVGAAAPGAGIVVTKWEHLNLKVELLRSVSKYGIGPPNKIQARVLPFMLKGSDIIAQAPPTQERIISYVVPALQLCLSTPAPNGPYRGPTVIVITTTVDQATQCHKLVRNIGGPLGIRSALAAGAAGSSSLASEVAAMQRDAVHLLVGTPAKVLEVMAGRGGLGGSECRLLILDEVDQLIARNLYESVLSIAKLLPSPRRGNTTGALTPTPFSPGGGLGAGMTSPYDQGMQSPFNPNSKVAFPSQAAPGAERQGGSRFGAPGQPIGNGGTLGGLNGAGSGIERQTCLFSNTIPTDVINFSQTLQVRDPVRVLVRREGGPNSQESVSSVTPGINLKHTYVYLTITGSATTSNASNGSGAADSSGPGTIGSGRVNGGSGGGPSEESTRAKEYKLDMLVKMLDDYPLWQAVIHVGTYAMLEAVVYKLSSRSWETLYLTSDMPPAQKKAVLSQWRLSLAGNGPRFLVVFDVNVKPPEIPWSPLVINFDLPRSVEGYAHRAAAAVPPANRSGPQVNGVIVSFVQAAGGDVEMLRSTECAYRFKSAEIPSVFHDLFQH